MKRLIILLLHLLLAASAPLSVSNIGGEDKVLLRDITALTFQKGLYTKARRTSPIPQLQCTSGCGAHTLQVVQCRNVGWDGSSVQWDCKADMNKAYRLGPIEVSCEGYSHSNDEYVLQGSCGLRYALERTGKEERPATTIYTILACLLVVAVLLLIGYVIYRTCCRKPTTPRFPGAGPTGAMPAAPPPYYAGANPYYGNQGHYAGGGGGYGRGYGRGSGSFWPGLGLGGLAGYMFGSNRSRPRYYNDTPHYTSLFGGSGGSGGSSGTHTTSGFGGTTIRAQAAL